VKRCSKCGYENEENTAFCQNCGERLENNGNVQVAAIKPKRNNNQTLIIIAAIVAAAAVAIAAMFMVSAHQSKKAKSMKTSASKTQQSTQNNTQSATKTASQSSNAQQTQQKSSASASQGSQYNANTLSGKQIGVLLMLYWSPDWFKDEVTNGSMYYEEAATDEDTTYYLTASGRGDETLDYRINGDTITYEYLKDSGTATETISLQRLVGDYYNTSDKRSEVNGYVGQIKPVSEAPWGTDNY
jgi:cobalamin biosynthesis Mg chelatase CobN